MSMLKRAQPAADEDEGYHSRHVMLQIEMGAEAGHESQRHTPSTYGGTVSRWSFYDLYIRHIRYIPISCVLSLHSFSFASISFFAESIDLGGHSGLGRQKELMRRNVLGRRQSNTGKWSYKSYNIYQYLTYVRILTLLAYLFYPIHVFQMQSPDLQASDPLQKFRRHCGRSVLPASPTGVQPVHMRSDGHTLLSTCPIVPWFSLKQGARPGKATARAEGKRRAWRARVLGGAHNTYWQYWHISHIRIY
jgi:hypothetical protein